MVRPSVYSIIVLTRHKMRIIHAIRKSTIFAWFSLYFILKFFLNFYSIKNSLYVPSFVYKVKIIFYYFFAHSFARYWITHVGHIVGGGADGAAYRRCMRAAIEYTQRESEGRFDGGIRERVRHIYDKGRIREWSADNSVSNWSSRRRARRSLCAMV